MTLSFLNLICYRLKLHEDWGTTPAAIDCALTAAEKHDVQVSTLLFLIIIIIPVSDIEFHQLKII